MAYINTLHAPHDLVHEQLHSTFAIDLMTRLAEKLGQERFTPAIRTVFGDDLSLSACAELWHRLMQGTLTSPDLVLTEFLGYEADYDNRERVIRIDWGFFSSTTRQPQRHWLLMTALLHEFGHHIDNLLRQDFSDAPPASDAPWEEGHLFTAWVAEHAAPAEDQITFARYSVNDHPDSRQVFIASWRQTSEAIARFQSTIGVTHGNTHHNTDREAFEAGDGSAQHLTHKEIEKALYKLDFSGYDLSTIYFGNWLRDHSQLVDPKIVRAASMPRNFPDVLSRDALTRIVDVLSIKPFRALRQGAPAVFTVTPQMLGVYRPSEHIDNPKTTDLKSPDPTTLDPEFEPLVFPDTEPLGIDYETSMKRYISRSVDFMSQELRIAMDRQRAPDGSGLRAFGSALHVLEDFFAHSNFVELALIKNGHSKVLPWTSPAECKAGLPLVTGTFGASDTVASLAGPLANILFSTDDVTYMPVKAGDRSEREQVLLILLSEHHNPKYLEIYETYLQTRDTWVDLPFVEFLQRSAAYLQKLSAVVGNATGIIMNNMLKVFGENIDEWQIRYGQDPHKNGSTDPTHSQLAKDHAEHPLHLLAGSLASVAVKEVATAMADYWSGDESADPIAVARAFFAHPHDTEWQDEIVGAWAVANPQDLARSTSKEELFEIYKQLAKSGRRALDQLRRDGTAYLSFLRGELVDSTSPLWLLSLLTPTGPLAHSVLLHLGLIKPGGRDAV